MLFGQVPVLFVDGEQVAHSRAALRYVGREFKLDGRDSLTAAKVDMWIEVLVEGLSKIRFSETDEKKRVSLQQRRSHQKYCILGGGFDNERPLTIDFSKKEKLLICHKRGGNPPH